MQPTTEQSQPGITILDIGLEGGGATIFGRVDNGTWCFWREGVTIALDDNDEEEWRDTTSAVEPTIAALLPSFWLMCVPITIHPEFIGQIRMLYADAVASLSEVERRSFDRYRRQRWESVLGR